MAIHIDHDICEATGVCAQVCPEDVIKHESGRTEIVDASKCTECWICVEHCSAGAIEID